MIPKQLEFRPLEVQVQENDVGRALSPGDRVGGRRFRTRSKIIPRHQAHGGAGLLLSGRNGRGAGRAGAKDREAQEGERVTHALRLA